VASGGNGQQASGGGGPAHGSRRTSSFGRLRVGPPSTCDRSGGGLLALDRGGGGLLALDRGGDEQERQRQHVNDGMAERRLLLRAVGTRPLLLQVVGTGTSSKRWTMQWQCVPERGRRQLLRAAGGDGYSSERRAPAATASGRRRC
jgi:hypothetical protein